MAKIVGKIKITEDRVVTTKSGLVETWSKFSGDENCFIVYQGNRYKLLRSKETEIESDNFVDDYEDEVDS